MTALRADVDNVIKPTRDALKGVVYVDDRQVRSVKAVALPLDDAFRAGAAHTKVFSRVMKTDEFLSNAYDGSALDLDLRVAVRPTAT